MTLIICYVLLADVTRTIATRSLSPTNTDMSTIDLKIEFGGGLELLFGNQRAHTLSLPTLVPTSPADTAPSTPSKSTDVTYLIRHLRTHLLKERPELFVEGDTVYVPSPL